MSASKEQRPSGNAGLIRQVVASHQPGAPLVEEEVWIEVIQKMDEVYSDLVRSQVEIEKKNVELEDAQTFIRSVLAAMTDVLIVCDVSGKIQQTNTALEKLTGFHGTDFLGRYFDDLLTPESANYVSPFKNMIASNKIHSDCEVNLRTNDGKDVELAVNFSPRYNNRGKLVGMVLIGRPVGELRRAYADLDQAHRKLRKTQQQLVASEKMAALGRLVAGVAHELNNPISFIFGNMHALKRYGSSISEYLNALDSDLEPSQLYALRQKLKIDLIVKDIVPLVDGTLEGSERVRDIVQDLRRFSSGQKDVLERFDITSVLRTAVDWVTKTTNSVPTLEFHMPDSLEVMARKGHVHQVIVNLVQNAFDMMSDQKTQKLVLSSGKDKNVVWVTVRDFGPGISDADMPHIFEPFFTTKPIGEGTGLGLYISYGLVEEHGGSITAENHPDGGAVFRLTLPEAENNDS